MLQANKIQAIINPVSNLTEIEIFWRELEKNNSNSFFLTWSWLGPWARLIMQHTSLYIFVLKEENTVIAISFITLCKVRRMKGLITVNQVQVNEYLAKKCNMVIQYNGLLVKKGYEQIGWSNLFQALKGWDKTWDEIGISSMTNEQINIIRDEDFNLKLVIDETHRPWKVPIKRTANAHEELLNTFKSKSRQQLRQSLKACHTEFGEICVTPAENHEQALNYFMEMETLHTTRWVKAGESGSFANPNWVKFHKDVIITGYPRGEIIMLRVHGTSETVGYLYGCIFSGTAYMIQTGFIESKNNRLRPGYVSHFHAMLYCMKNNLNCYDFLPDDEGSYKKFFTNPGEPIHWIQLQKRKMKFFIEKILRFIIIYIRNRKNH